MVTWPLLATRVAAFPVKLYCACNGILHYRGKLHDCEPCCRIQIVFTAFIDNADVSISLRNCVRDDAINLVQFERCRVVSIADAYCKPTCFVFLSFHRSVQKAFALQLFLSDPVGLIPMQFCQSDLSAGQSDPGNAPELPPEPAPIILAKPRNVPNPGTSRDDFDTGYFANDLEVHIRMRCAQSRRSLSLSTR